MTRKLLALALLIMLAPSAQAQDMPLSQILIDGEGWTAAKGKPEKPKAYPHLYRCVYSNDGGTLFWASCGRRSSLLASPCDQKGVPLRFGIPYGSLRLPQDEPGISVGGLVIDRDGRIYAATEIGVQVFDPTGRMCGVLTPAAPGKPEHLAFEGDQLTLWIGDTKYTRTLRTVGAK